MAMMWSDGPENHADLLVMLALADWSDDAGNSWPSMSSIAQKSRVDERSARRIVRRLEADGWLTIETGGGRNGVNKYRINPDRKPPIVTKKPGQKVPPDRKSPGPLMPETRTVQPPEPSLTIKEDTQPNGCDGDAVISEDFAKQVFDRAVAYLGRHGTPERQARTFVGRLRKDHSDSEIFEAFMAASKEGAVDPIPWIVARLVPPKYEITFDLSKFEDSNDPH